MKKLILVTLLILTLSFMLFAQKAEKPMMGKDCENYGEKQMMMKKGEGGHNQMGMHMDMWKELDLTKEQKTKLEDMRNEHQKYMVTKQAELKNLHIDKQNAMKKQDYNKVKQLNKNIADLELAIENSKVDQKQAMMKELTKEQQDKLNEMRPMLGKGKMHDGKNRMKKGLHK